MSYLDPSTVEEIVKLRPIYIGIRCLPGSTIENMVVDYKCEKVMLSLLKNAFKNIKHHYDPCERWFSTQRHVQAFQHHHFQDMPRWVDRWNSIRRSSCNYSIEEWQPEKGLSKALYFNFDWWYKNKIASEKLSQVDVIQQLATWNDELMRDHIPTELLERWSSEREHLAMWVPGEQAAWVKVYGCSVERAYEYD